MRQGFILTGLALAVWIVSTLFFSLFGDWVLGEVGEANFGSSLFLLEILTFLVLIGLSLVVRLRLFPEKGSATRFGFTAAAVGLLLDTFTVMKREQVFPDFSEQQHHAWSVWMTLAYAMFLLVPAVVDRLVPEKKSDIRAEEPEELGLPEDETKASSYSAHAEE
ncbi:hypothetical protein ACFPVX_11715 [Cohnella faecalis]|uniref:DUF5367 domain-containing protein n=1 Tax=Cohnella faecalis TaxID=2315694 RepID=A0A398CN93_9BACL|nr:hypothetical protein [Cohnella faecalis]RIE03700.1 hypothetical protein D3H35_10400 [Cohnella faecalis]